MIRTLVFIVLAFNSIFAFQQELTKDDGSFEDSELTSYTEGRGQSFITPDSYTLLNAKVYLTSHTGLLSIYVYTWYDPVNLLGIATLSNPVNGWNLVNLSNIQLPSTLPAAILICARDSGEVGLDTTPPNNMHYRVVYGIYTLFDNAMNNIGIRLIINNSPPGVQATSLGSIKASFH